MQLAKHSGDEFISNEHPILVQERKEEMFTKLPDILEYMASQIYPPDLSAFEYISLSCGVYIYENLGILSFA